MRIGHGTPIVYPNSTITPTKASYQVGETVSAGDGLQWVVSEPATLVEDFGEVFTLVPAPATRGGTRLSLGLGL